MARWASILYRKEAKRLEIDPEVIKESLRQANFLNDRDLLPVLTLRHLAHLTNTPYLKLRMCIVRSDYVNGEGSKTYRTPYRTFHIRKKTCGYRTICVPDRDLLKVQRYIDQFILSKVKASHFSYAFEKGQSIVDCAQQHLGCKWLIKIDLRNFFESLSEIQVYRVFSGLGYNSLIAFELTRLCTKMSNSAKKNQSSCWINYNKKGIPPYQCSNIGHLPQGAPTSPKLANLIVRSLDTEIADIADSFGLVYTRYADDLAFSTEKKDFGRETAKEFILKIFAILPKYGLSPHHQKTHIIPPGARKIILGLLVDSEDKVRLSKDFRSKLECHWYYCAKDPVAHAEQRGFESIFGLKNYLNGLIAYAKQIDSAFVDKLQVKFGMIEWPI